MDKEQLINFIKSELDKSRTREDIEQALLNEAKFTETEIKEAGDKAEYLRNASLSFESKKGIYSAQSIAIGTFFGGIFVTGYLISENEKELGNHDKALLAKRVAIGGLILTFVLAIIVERFFGDKSNQIMSEIGYLPTLLGFLWLGKEFKKFQGFKKQGYKMRKVWPAICIIFVVIVLIINILTFIGETQIQVDDQINSEMNIPQ